MSATPADDAQTSPAWNCGCKDTNLFWIVQEKCIPLCIFMFKGRGEPLLFRGYRLGFTRIGFVKHPITPQAGVIGDPAANR